MIKLKHAVLLIAIGIFMSDLSACAHADGEAQPETPSKPAGSVQVETKTIGRVHLLPPTKDCHNVLVSIKCQDQLRDFGPSEIETVSNRIQKGLEEKGYRIVAAAAEADYVILGAVIFAGEADPEYLQGMYRSGYGTQRVAREKKPDLIASGVGYLTDKVRARSYGLVIDYRLDSSQRTKTGVVRQKSTCRIVSGVPSSRKSLEETMPAMQESMATNFIQLF